MLSGQQWQIAMRTDQFMPYRGPQGYCNNNSALLLHGISGNLTTITNRANIGITTVLLRTARCWPRGGVDITTRYKGGSLRRKKSQFLLHYGATPPVVSLRTDPLFLPWNMNTVEISERALSLMGPVRLGGAMRWRSISIISVVHVFIPLTSTHYILFSPSIFILLQFLV